MSTIQTNAIVDAAGGNTASVNGVTPNTHSVRGRNLITNGAMQVAQRGTTQTTATSNTYHTVDRWIEEHSSSINIDFAQVSGSAPSGFQKSLKCTAQSTATLGANDYIVPFEQRFERTQIDSIGLGTSEAKTFTLSFWIKSNRTGTYTVNPTLDSPTSTSGQSTTKQYTIDSANTWEYKTITFPANTIASPNVNDNIKGVTLFWWMLAGSNFTSGSLPSGWKVEVANERAIGCSNTVSTGDNWQITGVQLELGSVATEFDHRSYGEELQLCKRYYQTYGGGDLFEHLPFYVLGNGTVANFNWGLPVEMRTVPSLSTVGTWSVQGPYGGSVYNVGSFVLGNTSSKTIRGDAQSLSGSIGTNVARVFALSTTAVRFNLSADL
jgi:hypothetical protein